MQTVFFKRFILSFRYSKFFFKIRISIKLYITSLCVGMGDAKKNQIKIKRILSPHKDFIEQIQYRKRVGLMLHLLT